MSSKTDREAMLEMLLAAHLALRKAEDAMDKANGMLEQRPRPEQNPEDWANMALAYSALSEAASKIAGVYARYDINKGANGGT